MEVGGRAGGAVLLSRRAIGRPLECAHLGASSAAARLSLITNMAAVAIWGADRAAVVPVSWARLVPRANIRLPSRVAGVILHDRRLRSGLLHIISRTWVSIPLSYERSVSGFREGQGQKDGGSKSG